MTSDVLVCDSNFSVFFIQHHPTKTCYHLEFYHLRNDHTWNYRYLNNGNLIVVIADYTHEENIFR